MKSITLQLVVAGTTYFNQLDRFQGWSGTPLTVAGQEASLAVGQQLDAVTFDTAFASDTSRATQTGHAILNANAQPVELQVLTDLRGPFYGGFEGLERASVWSGFATKLGYPSVAAFANDQTPTELQTLLHDHDADRLAESGEAFWARYQTGLQEILTATPDHGRALVIVDSAALREIRYRATALQSSREELAPSTVAVVTYDGDNFTLQEA